MIDPASIFEGALAGLLSTHTQKIIESQAKHTASVTDILNDIHCALVDFEIWYKNTQEGSGDIYRFATLYKLNQGPSWLPFLDGRKHLILFSPVEVTLDVTAPGLIAFNLTLAGASWTDMSFPDNTGYLLNSSYTSNSLNVWYRLTNED